VLALHDEDELCPIEKLRGERILRVVIQTGRGALDAGMIGEDLFRGRAPPAILAADEEDAKQQ
jgi:hypothetical protein